ncbi:MAG: trehalose-phosphatase, partial [Rhodospirillaceae bacterium]|nr:trehalose-phosphatase [Rhodospirillaceae bacterium]
MEAFASRNPGVVVEDKTLSMGLHFRNCPAAEGPATELAQELIGEFGDGLFLQKGKMLVEIRPGRGDKGTAIADFMAEAPFQGRLPVFIGDDVTDESGFELVNAQGGHSIRVGNGAKTAARFRVDDVMGVIRWLEQIVKAER